MRPVPGLERFYSVTDDGRVMPLGYDIARCTGQQCPSAANCQLALIPARTETAMFYETVWGEADGVLFIKGRPHFHYVCGRRADFNSGAPIALVAYGRGNLEALRHSGLGFVVVTHNAEVRDAAPLYGAASLSTDGLCGDGKERT